MRPAVIIVRWRYRKVMSARAGNDAAVGNKLTIGTRTLLVLGVAGLVAGLLAAADVMLVRFGISERMEDARELYEHAEKLNAAGQHSRALDLYRQARNEQRNNGTYRIALIQALQRAGRMEEAEAEARRLVIQQPTDGPVNLVMARLLESGKRYDEAAWFYHRALYGNWSGSAEQRTRIRLELADMLARQGRTEEVVAEVLLVLNEEGTDIHIRRRSADLLMKSGASQRAAVIYADLVARSPDDPTLHAALGLAFFGEKEYRRARGELAAAVRLGESGEEVRRKLEISQAVVERDPNARGVGFRELERRRIALLHEVIEIARTCGADVSSTPLVAAQKLVSKRRGAHADPDDELEAAEGVWGILPPRCKSGPKAEAISILFAGSSPSRTPPQVSVNRSLQNGPRNQ